MRSVKEYFSFLYKVYLSMLIIPCLLLIFALVVTEPNRFSEHDIPYLIADGVVILIGILFVYFFFQKKIKEAQKKRGLREKLSDYRKAVFVSWTVLLNITLFSIACYLIRGEHLFVCTAIFTLVILALNKPNASKLIERLDLENDEQRILENPNSAI